MSRIRPPPMPIMMPMMATPSQSSRRWPWNPDANIAPWTPPRPTPSRSAHSGMVKSGSVTRPFSRTEDNRRVPTYRDEAVILRTHKLGEADRIVTMLSRRHGKVRAVAKGVRRTSSKFGARLEPFMVADVQLYQGRSLDIVQQAESLGSYGTDIAAHYDRFTAANAMVETADRLSDAEATPDQYLLLVGGLRALSRGEHVARSILDSYLLRVMSLSGWAPSLDESAHGAAHQGRTRGSSRSWAAWCARTAPRRQPTRRREDTGPAPIAHRGGVGRDRRRSTRRHRRCVRTRLRLRPMAPGARHPLARPRVRHHFRRRTVSPKPYTHKDAVAYRRWTGRACIRPRSAPYPRTSRS